MNVIGCFLSLSRSLDFSHQGLMRHHRRTALIAAKLGQAAGMLEKDLLKLVQTALIHDIGVISWQEKVELSHLEIETPWEHCRRGADLLEGNRYLNDLADIVLSHHDRWTGNNPSGLKGNQIPLASRIIHLADRVDILLPDRGNILDQKNNTLKALQRLEGELFDSELIALLGELARNESFWLDLTSPWEAYLLEDLLPIKRVPMELDYLHDIAGLFARVVDAKSPFTYRHSRGVAWVARFLGEQLGLPDKMADCLEIAGLLHDLGKLSVPVEILEKPGQLSASEFNLMKQHAYYTYWLLKPVTQVFPLAEWAAYHHEKPDGKGYPFGKKADELDQEAGMIKAADIFVALREERPYRPGMNWEKIAAVLREMAEYQGLSGEMVAILLDNRIKLDQAWEELS